MQGVQRSPTKTGCWGAWELSSMREECGEALSFSLPLATNIYPLETLRPFPNARGRKRRP